MDERHGHLNRAAPRRVGSALVLLIAVAALVGGATAAPALTERVSVKSNGKEGNDISGRFTAPVVSADGLVAAFDSVATDLVGGDNNGVDDVFAHDRSSGTTERVSVDSKGKQANGLSLWPSVSGDGRFVAFQSVATNLVPGDTNGAQDVFVHDRLTGVTMRASVASHSGRQADGASNGPAISADGRFVAFVSGASNLVPGGVPGVYVHDLLKGGTERVSVDSAGNQGNNQSVGPGIRGGPTFGPKISGDGRFVAFDSIATNLVPDDTNTCALRSVYSFLVAGQCPDVFVHDRQTGATFRVSVDSAGAQSNGPSTDPAINGDGSVVAFFSAAT